MSLTQYKSSLYLVIIIALHTKFETSRLAYMERKKNKRTDEQINQEGQLSLTQYKYTKSEASSFCSSWEIFDKKNNTDFYGEKEEWENK